MQKKPWNSSNIFMNMLVLDTIHGADVIGREFAALGHTVDIVDVYRQRSVVDTRTALGRTYDLVVAPVHLDPDHPLLLSNNAPIISHHEAVRRLLGDRVPQPMVEVTGARGKTTTAFALAHIMAGAGVLHTSAGTFLYPEHRLLWKRSITPASVLAAADTAIGINGWLIAEESLGVTGAGSLAIITSADDYVCAAGKKSALAEKLKSVKNSPRVLLAPSLPSDTPAMVALDNIARCSSARCFIHCGSLSGSFHNPLLELDSYRIPLMLAGAAACLLGINPASLSGFLPIEGRLSVRHAGNVTIVDNANSGTNFMTTIEAARYARAIAKVPNLTLVIGIEPGDGAVCDGFTDNQILDAIDVVMPERVILVGDILPGDDVAHRFNPTNTARSSTFKEACDTAIATATCGSIVLAVKTWR
jgi:coenzyme F430 synthetase